MRATGERAVDLDADLPDNRKTSNAEIGGPRSGRWERSVKSEVEGVIESPQPGDDDCEASLEVRLESAEVQSNDPNVLRAALIRETAARRRAECFGRMQADVVQRALDLLVLEPDIERFFGGLTKMMVDEGESHTCAVWLIDEPEQCCELWMAYVKDALYAPHTARWSAEEGDRQDEKKIACDSMATHLFGFAPGWSETIEYRGDDSRLPEMFREFSRRKGADSTIATPLRLGTRTLGWMTVSSSQTSDCDRQWQVALLEAIARQAALALHQSRLAESNRVEERRKAILEERNRLARDIHDNLAQGFAAILMQLQAAQRAAGALPPTVASSVEVAVDLARTHLAVARRSVGALRPNVGDGEDIATAIKRLADLGQRATGVPIDVVLDELPRLGDGVEREIIGIAQEALTNAVRHSRARRITIRASTEPSLGFRLSIADDGRGIARDRSGSGFGMTSMQERAERIGASLTIVTAPRNGTEVVLAWEPSSLPTQIHVAN
jgi:signal transduction histidine kinase